MLSESMLIEKIRSFFPAPAKVRKGIGDDAAVLPWDKRHELLLTVDAIVDGVDFHLKQTRPEAVGWKALAINLSDIAAMGGLPLYALVSLGIPAGFSYAWIRRFYAGMKKLAGKFRVAVVGGDLTRSKVFFASVTVAGRVEKHKLVLRDSAKAGDSIFVTGRLGRSILEKHLKFTPRLREARFLVERFKIHAMMDLSDGLMRDLAILMKESKKGACVFTEDIPVSREALRARKRNISPLRSALCDGEDFELVFTASPGEAKKILALKHGLLGTPLSCIGRVKKSPGIVFQRSEKDTEKLRWPWKGYEHF